jgi:fermentation-respiration switch protein FrsA (DUF1100 family)
MEATSRPRWDTLFRRTRTLLVIVLALDVLQQVASASAQARSGVEARQTISIRGHEQVLHLYGTRGGTPVIVSSGDGGWIHLGPHAAEMLSANGFFVVGFDAKAYLESFTNGTTTLGTDDEPGDYKAIIDVATGGTDRKLVLIGVSEGAGLSVLAATDPRNKDRVAGVIGLGLSDLTELGWRWKDMVIYLSHGTPHEPTFSVKAVVDRMAPIPLAAIHSTRDEYVPVAEVEQVLERAGQPKRLWIVNAANHRFSDNLAEFDRTLLEAIAWIADAHGGVVEMRLEPPGGAPAASIDHSPVDATAARRVVKVEAHGALRLTGGGAHAERDEAADPVHTSRSRRALLTADARHVIHAGARGVPRRRALPATSSRRLLTVRRACSTPRWSRRVARWQRPRDCMPHQARCALKRSLGCAPRSRAHCGRTLARL